MEEPIPLTPLFMLAVRLDMLGKLLPARACIPVRPLIQVDMELLVVVPVRLPVHTIILTFLFPSIYHFSFIGHTCEVFNTFIKIAVIFTDGESHIASLDLKF